jgi:hypothetical protein
MFIGHFGVGFGAKAAAPKTSLGALFLAAQFVDLLWPTLTCHCIQVANWSVWTYGQQSHWVDRHREAINVPQ